MATYLNKFNDSKQMIIGIAGLNGSGKGEAAKILKEQGFQYFSLSNIIREELIQKDVEINRKKMIEMGNELRKKFTPGVLAERTLNKLEKRNPYIIDSIRNLGEVVVLRTLPNFYLVGIRAPLKIRFERIKKRKRDKDAVSLKEFKQIEKIDGLSESNMEQQTLKCIKKADIIVLNNSSLEALKEKMSRVLLDLGIREIKRLKKRLLKSTIKM